MNRKVYLAPQAEVIQLEANAILAGSTGATGEDIPWARSKVRNSIFDDDLENDYE